MARLSQLSILSTPFICILLFLSSCASLPKIEIPGEHELKGEEFLELNISERAFLNDFILSFSVKPRTVNRVDIVGVFNKHNELWKVYFPANKDKIRFISRSDSLDNTTMIDVKYSDYAQTKEWTAIQLIRRGQTIYLKVNNKLAGKEVLKDELPMLNKIVKFGHLGHFDTNINIKDISFTNI